VSVIEVVTGVSVPEVPVMVTGEDPTAAVALAVKVSTLVVLVTPGANVAVIPAGNPDADRVTLPVNGLISVTVMVTEQLPPWGIVQLIGEGAIVKLPDETVS